MLEIESGVGLITIVTAGRTLALATADLNCKLNRTNLAEFQKAHWGLNRFAMGLSERDVAVDDCPVTWTDDEVRRFTRSDIGLFLPEVCSTAPEGLRLQAKAYPGMFWEEQNVPALVRNEDEEGKVISLFGWLKTEKSIDAPNTRTDETKAKEIVARKNRSAQTLNVYGEAGQQSKLLAGQFLDEVRTYVRVLSSRVGGRVVNASFDPGGRCSVYWLLEPSNVHDDLGVRSVGV